MSSTILGVCPICTEQLEGGLEPVAMPCGHLYCLSCASQWFYIGDAPQTCTICRKGFRGEDIIKLWLTTEGSSRNTAEASENYERGDLHGRGEEVAEACAAVLMNLDTHGDSAALSTALRQTEIFVNDMSESSHSTGIKNILKNIRAILFELHTTLQRGVQTPTHAATHSSTPSSTQETRQKQAKLELDIQELYREQLLAEEAGVRAQINHDRIEQDLRDRLQDERRAHEITKRHLDDAQRKATDLEEEVKRLRKSELRYRKKYHALKQEVAATKRSARGSHPHDEDDSLIVV